MRLRTTTSRMNLPSSSDYEKVLRAGDGYYVAPNLPHGCVCLEAGVLVDTFSPMREDFLK